MYYTILLIYNKVNNKKEVFTMNVKGVSIRFTEEMLNKIGYIADYEGRSVNSHVLVLVRENIAKFEQEHGKIEGEIPADVNVKPTRKN